jgi:RHS repeat-associated protein
MWTDEKIREKRSVGRAAEDHDGWPLVVWKRANTGGTGEDLYGQRLWGDGRPSDDDPAFTLVEAAGDQESPAFAGNGTGGWLVAWQDEREAYQERSGWYRNGDWDIYGTTVQDERRVIAYEYDGLYRLTEASYSTGEGFRYDYDAVGNREAMTVTTPLSGTEVTTYTYDAANRLTSVGGVALSWDNNGNLLQDHEGTVYAYDTPNRLTRVVQDGVTYTFSYNATGDRLSQSVGGAVTTYTLDLYGGLTQVLGDGTSVYLYGLGRIGEEGAAGWLTHLGDALGSVRQLADGDGEVVGDRSYRPYGGVLESGGSGGSAYGFAGEWTDGTGLVFLRARYMDPRVGRFLTRDPWKGSAARPSTLNGFDYATANPINLADPSGLCGQAPDCLPPSPIYLGGMPAELAVLLARTAYLKAGPLRICALNPDDGQSPSDTVNDLLTDFVCEYGPNHRFFGADARLTQELARTATIHKYRAEFYRSGGQLPSGEHSFEVSGFLLATMDALLDWDWVRISGLQVPFNVTHFLGTVKYTISQWGNEARFQIDNDTDLASGTRIPQILGGADPNSPHATTVEDVISQEPHLAHRPLWWIMETRPIVSILNPRPRGSDLLLGGGTMHQTFEWCESYPLFGCVRFLPPWPSVVPFLNVRTCSGGGGSVGFGE